MANGGIFPSFFGGAQHLVAAEPGIHKEMPFDASNVMLICPKCGKACRVSHKVDRVQDENGKAHRKMIRVCKKCGAEID